MNKLTLAAAVALCASVGFSEGIASNIVGYNTTDLNTNGKFTTIVVPFLNVTDKTAGLSLYDLSGNFTQGAAGTADQIWIWNSNAWDKYYLTTEGKWKQTVYPRAFFEANYPDGLPEGTGLYLKARGSDAKAVTGSGAVETEAQVSIALRVNGQFTFVGNPYPTTLDITDANQFEITDVSKGDSGIADQIWIWKDGIAWDKYYLTTDGKWKQTVYPRALFTANYPDGLPVGTVLYIKARGSAAKEVVFKKTF